MLPDEPPMMFRWRRVMYRVVKADGPERLAAEWWRGENAGAADALRDYYRVEDADGRRFWLYPMLPTAPVGARPGGSTACLPE